MPLRAGVLLDQNGLSQLIISNRLRDLSDLAIEQRQAAEAEELLLGEMAFVEGETLPLVGE